MALPDLRVIAIGNPGAGKSTILNSLGGEILFRSGVSIREGLAYQLDEKVNARGRFFDTPGLADDTHREAAGKAISTALSKGGPYRVLFFMRTESGRIVREDITTLKLVLDAAPEIGKQYAIVANKIPKEVAILLEKHGQTEKLLTKKLIGNPEELLLQAAPEIDKQYAIEDNLKRLMVFGESGTGKSSLCNVLTGRNYNDTLFPTSDSPTNCTKKSIRVDADFCGDAGKPLSIIDTIEFCQPSKKDDQEIIDELTSKLQGECGSVNMFLLTANGQHPRIGGSLLKMLRILEKIFSDKIWDHLAVAFTRQQMSKDQIERREDDGLSDDARAKEYMTELGQHFGGKGRNIRYFFIDSKYRAENKEENDAFKENTDNLYNLLKRMSPLSN